MSPPTDQATKRWMEASAGIWFILPPKWTAKRGRDSTAVPHSQRILRKEDVQIRNMVAKT